MISARTGAAKSSSEMRNMPSGFSDLGDTSEGDNPSEVSDLSDASDVVLRFPILINLKIISVTVFRICK